MKNRIKGAVTPEGITEFMDLLNQLDVKTRSLMANVDTNELLGGQFMGTDAGWNYAQKGNAIAKKFPKLCDPEEIDVEKFNNNILLAEFLIGVAAKLSNLDTWTNSLLMLVGKDLMEQTSVVRNTANRKKSSVPEYAQPSDELNDLYVKRADKATETKKNNETIRQLKEELAKKKEPVV